MQSIDSLFTPFTLPCGKVVPNRVVKAAMEENLAGQGQLPDTALFNLYRYWAQGHLGMIITGNVMVDKKAMTGPGGVALEASTDIAPFKQWAEIIKSGGALAIMQINHPGRQVFKRMGGKALAPSDVALNMGRHSSLFDKPKAMSQEEISDVTQRFVTTALRAQEAGFDGVEVHAAHGYLLAQFLSPLVNHRDDEWGGALTNRARLLINIVCQIRAHCGPDFVVMVKINSADFQRGGFAPEDAQAVVDMLTGLKVDVVELSGGSYESPAMQGTTQDDRTLAREAYFLEFAKNIASHSSIPVMTTGGIKRAAVAQRVLEQGCDLVGMASALASTPDLARKWQLMSNYQGSIPVCHWRDKTLAGLARMAMVKRQLRMLASNRIPLRQPSPFWSLVLDQLRMRRLTKRYRTSVD